MTAISIGVEIMVGSLLGKLPGAGYLLNDKIALKMATELRDSVEEEFSQRCIVVGDSLSVGVKKIASSKGDHGGMAITVEMLLKYEVLNHHAVALSHTTGFKRFFLRLAKWFLDVSSQVNQEVRQEVIAQIHTQLPLRLEHELKRSYLAAEPVRILVE